MIEARLRRLFDVVMRQLGASDARVELGGKPPTDERLVWCALPSGWRLVVVFDAPPEDRDVCVARLVALAEAFASTATAGGAAPSAASPAVAARRLDDELYAVASRADAVRAVVIDDKSPVIWGTSEARRGAEDVDLALRTTESLAVARDAGIELCDLLDADPDQGKRLLAERGLAQESAASLMSAIDRIREGSRRRGAEAWRHHLLTARAIAGVRSHDRGAGEPRSVTVREPDFGLVARPFAGMYWLVLVFDGAFSELHADGAAIHALPAIERLVLALPPVDPPPRAGKVLQLKR